MDLSYNPSPRELWLERRVHVLESELKYLRRPASDFRPVYEEPKTLVVDRINETLQMASFVDASLVADGRSRRYHVRLTDFKNKLGQPYKLAYFTSDLDGMSKDRAAQEAQALLSKATEKIINDFYGRPTYFN